MLQKTSNIFVDFLKEEDGLALTEYLILLGLLVGAVIASVLIIGEELSAAWATWATFFQGTDLDAPPPSS